MKLIGYKSCAAAVLVYLAISSLAFADSVTLGQWYEFRFFEAGSFGEACTGQTCFPGADSVFAPASPWTYFAAVPTTVKITDGFPSGDSFSLFDFGVFIGSTPPVDLGPGCGELANVCYSDPTMSHGMFDLAPGVHALTIRADISPLETGAASFASIPFRNPPV